MPGSEASQPAGRPGWGQLRRPTGLAQCGVGTPGSTAVLTGHGGSEPLGRGGGCGAGMRDSTAGSATALRRCWDFRRAMSVWQLHYNMYLKALEISAPIKPPLPHEAGVYWEPREGGAGAQGWADWPLCSAQDAPSRRLASGLGAPGSVPGGPRGCAPDPGSPRKQGALRTGGEGENPSWGGWRGVLRPNHAFHDSQAPPDTVPLTPQPCRTLWLISGAVTGPGAAAPFVSRSPACSYLRLSLRVRGSVSA